MHLLQAVSYFLGGVVLTNALPHLTSGLAGRHFPTPFAKPPGRGLPSPTVNVLWAFLNLVVAYLLVCWVGVFDFRSAVDALALGLGVLLASLMLARTFGQRLHGGDEPRQPGRS